MIKKIQEVSVPSIGIAGTFQISTNQLYGAEWIQNLNLNGFPDRVYIKNFGGTTIVVQLKSVRSQVHDFTLVTNYEANYTLFKGITDIRLVNTSAAAATTANLIYLRFEWLENEVEGNNGLEIRAFNGLTVQGRNEINPGVHALTMSQSAIDFAAAASNIVVAASTGNITRIWKLFIVSTAANTLTFEDSDGTNLSGAMGYAANSGIVLDLEQCPITCEIGKGFNILASGAGQVSGMVWFTQTTI